jgi:hypothetical protein
LQGPILLADASRTPCICIVRTLRANLQCCSQNVPKNGTPDPCVKAIRLPLPRAQSRVIPRFPRQSPTSVPAELLPIAIGLRHARHLHDASHRSVRYNIARAQPIVPTMSRPPPASVCATISAALAYRCHHGCRVLRFRRRQAPCRATLPESWRVTVQTPSPSGIPRSQFKFLQALCCGVDYVAPGLASVFRTGRHQVGTPHKSKSRTRRRSIHEPSSARGQPPPRQRSPLH